MRTPTLEVQFQLPLGWDTYLLFNSDIVNFEWKTDEGKAESIVLLFFVLWWFFNHWWVRGVGVGQKSYLRPAEIPSFSSRDFRRSNKHSEMLFRLDISTFYFYEPLFFQISVSHKFIKT